jgi:glycosyltransferase involved in cell wall biosynthesis
MNILIDATGITKNKAGVGVYAKNLIDELVGRRLDIRLFVLVQDDDPDFDYRNCTSVKAIRVPSKLFRILPLRFLLEQIGLPFLFLIYKIDVIHSLHYSFPLLRFGTKQVVTLHDMTFFNMPEFHVRFKVIYFRFFIWAAVRYADSLIFVSHSAKLDCNDRFGPSWGQSFVVYHGKAEAFRPNIDPEQVVNVRMKFKLPANFILYIGTIEPRKNIARLIKAFALIASNHPEVLLVIAGMKGWGTEDLFESVRNLKIESRVRFIGFVPEDEKASLLSGAKIFIYPSIYEGFGIPVLEALACGIPTITSNTSALPEVAGEAALLVDPTSVSEISNAMEQLLMDTGLRAKLHKESLRQAAQFTWLKTADLTLKIYKQTLNR